MKIYFGWGIIALVEKMPYDILLKCHIFNFQHLAIFYKGSCLKMITVYVVRARNS